MAKKISTQVRSSKFQSDQLEKLQDQQSATSTELKKVLHMKNKADEHAKQAIEQLQLEVLTNLIVCLSCCLLCTLNIIWMAGRDVQVLVDQQCIAGAE